MQSALHPGLKFETRSVAASFIDPAGKAVERPIEIRTHPITGRTCRITFSRIDEKEAGTESLPHAPPDAHLCCAGTNSPLGAAFFSSG